MTQLTVWSIRSKLLNVTNYKALFIKDSGDPLIRKLKKLKD